MGFVESNNGLRCNLHPDGCGNSLVLERDDHGIGMELRLRMKAVDEMACYTIKSDDPDGCRVSFLAKEYVASNRRVRSNGAIVQIVEVFLPNNPNRTARRLYHHNPGYTVGEIVSFPGPNYNNQIVINCNI